MKKRVLWSMQTDSHEAMRMEHDICESGSRSRILSVGIELTPPDGDFSRPADEWRFKVDQDLLPDWWNADEAEYRARRELDKWIAARVIRPGEMRGVKDGIFYATGDSRVAANRNATVMAYDESTVMVYEESVVKALGNSQVTAHDRSVVFAYDNSNVTALWESRVSAYDSSRVSAHAQATVFAHDESVIEARKRSVVRAHDDSTVTPLDESAVIAYGEGVTINMSNPHAFAVAIRREPENVSWVFTCGAEYVPRTGAVRKPVK